MNKNKKTILSLVSFTALILNLLLPAATQAYTVSLPGLMSGGNVNIDVNDILSEVNQNSTDKITNQTTESTESRYGFNEDIWRTAQSKENAPRVDIFFDNTNPKPGEKVTANAVTEFFKNDPQNLYYTWYLIHTKNGTPQTATNSINDGKIEASRIMAAGDYNSNLDEQNYDNSSNDPDNDGWPSVDDNSYDEDKTSAPMGGSDGVGGLTEESDNIERYNSSDAYCDARGGHSLSSCNVYTDKSSFNSYYTFKSSQSGDYCTYCQQHTTFSSTLSSDNACCFNVQNPSYDPSSPIHDPADPSYDPSAPTYSASTNYCPSVYDASYENCFDYATLQSTNSNLITDCLDTQYAACEDEWSALHDNNNYVEGSGEARGSGSEAYSRCYEHNFGTNADATGFRGYSGSSDSYGEDPSGKDYRTACKHKWQNAPGYKSGSGKFPTGEEKYWRSDPLDPDTDGDGQPDEADVIGLGQETFTWTYEKGDRVGLVVEGTSMIPTDEQNAYYKIMWGYLDVCDSSKTGLLGGDLCDDSNDYGFGFLATRPPQQEFPEEKIQTSLSFSPDNPLADASNDNKDNIADDGTINNADTITVTSSLDNTDLNPANLYYNWYIEKKNTHGEWKKMNIKKDFNASTHFAGMGISAFSFSPKKDALDKSEDITNFKISVAISRTASASAEEEALGRKTPKRGWASVEIPVNSAGIKLKLYKVDIKDGKAALGEEVCSDGLYKTLCPAVRFQMLAAKVESSKYKAKNTVFSWNLNGYAYSPPPDTSKLFDGWDDTTIFFPTIKAEQDIEELSVTATPKDALQPVTGSRLMTIVKPAAFIKSSDESTSWPMQYSTESQEVKGGVNTIQDNSMYDALTSSNAEYYLDFVPDYFLTNDSGVSIDWEVNGESIRSVDFYGNNPDLGLITLENSDKKIVIPTAETEGIYYSLGVAVNKFWNDDERNILYSAWGITPQTLIGNSSVTISTVSQPHTSDEFSASDPKQILAAVGTHLPQYFMYILRLALTILIMFFTSVLFYGLTQKLALYEEE